MDSKSAYQYDRAGLYIGITPAWESPREPGIYHLPANCTFIAPPEDVPDGKIPRWNGSSWEVISMPVALVQSPAQKLASFLAANPDVAALIGPL